MRREPGVGSPIGGSATTPGSKSQGPRWPVRLRELGKEIRSPRDQSHRDRVRGDTWVLLNSSLSRYLRLHSTRMGKLSREDLEDIAAQKSLDLLRKLEVGEWDMTDRSPSEITGFLSKVARNGFVDHLREAGRRVEPTEEDRPAWDVGAAGQDGMVGAENTGELPDKLVERKEFAKALRLCVDRINARSQRIWFLRAFCTMSSKEIATHPEVSLKPSHVDVIMQRAREAIRDCMHEKGYEAHDMPPGTFVELWRVFRLKRA